MDHCKGRGISARDAPSSDHCKGRAVRIILASHSPISVAQRSAGCTKLQPPAPEYVLALLKSVPNSTHLYVPKGTEAESSVCDPRWAHGHV
jgi:hypothetical protein